MRWALVVPIVLCCPSRASAQDWEVQHPACSLPTTLAFSRPAHGTSVECVRFSPDSKLLASYPDNLRGQEEVKVWSANGGKRVAGLRVGDGLGQALAWRSDGRYLATGGHREVLLWDAVTWDRVGTAIRAPFIDDGRRRGHGRYVYVRDIVFSPNGSRILAADQTGRMPLVEWSLFGQRDTNCDARVYYGDHAGEVVALSPCGRFVAVGSRGNPPKWRGAVTIFKLDTTTKLVTCDAKTPVNDLGWIPNSTRLVAVTGSDSVYRDGAIRVWDISAINTKEYKSYPRGWSRGEVSEVLTSFGHGAEVTSVVLQKSGEYVVTGSSDKSIRFWDPDTLTEIQRIDVGERVRCLDLTTDGLFLAAGLANGEVRIWKQPS